MRQRLALLLLLVVSSVLFNFASPSVSVWGCVDSYTSQIDAWHSNSAGLSPGDKLDALQEITRGFVDCILASSGLGTAQGFAFAHVPSAGSPTGVLFRFQNEFTSTSEPVRLTVYNGDGSVGGSFDEATIRVNGAIIASAPNFDGTSVFELNIYLVEGENQIGIETTAHESGSLVVVLTRNLLEPPH